ncbi:hypothetical protein MSHOH_3723 [Methanosarcina horonobensis HB-1 = JCM 15518]|uniref:DUF362 domain-containing protein n=2 Tax=Methanosarcina horonobensis TaxID=418008 RepID=A0A0E3SGG1_9EURY|nr:DUF362 domain-containing protein [Methanosarcina horonobensis]AKB80206.1 hypothetical protein MSHOH_3723 [Methanosarcina horonobensis HB-1 = JCM 15518]
MSARNESNPKGEIVNSQLGKIKVDSEGSPVAGSRMDTSKAYSGVPGLLKKVINENDKAAWAKIVEKVDYIYSNLDYSLGGLDRETGFASQVKSQIRAGKKLLFKPNLVGPVAIDAGTHCEGLGASICTEWPLIAALMRWFHDRLDINYYQMALGEASTSALLMTVSFRLASGKDITTEALFEGRSEDFYGGWGFFFVRRYLSERHPSSHEDDPMKGYEDSVAGKFFPPGRSGDQLMVYDLNKLDEDLSRGRTVEVPDGANYKEITLHKVIVGGDPGDSEDLKDYPGCILINVPKLKIHAQDLITNATKNLGIGLYPTQAPCETGDGETKWKYACPSRSVPSYKGELPHMPWIVKMDDKTNLPVKDENGEYITTKTAGMPGTQADVIRAVQNQNVFMVHVSDGIDMINICHNPDGRAVRIPEGYVWASLDCVALDLLCARYCFKTVSMREALKLKEENGWPTEFVHHVPVARVDGTNIATEEGLDSPLFRYNLYRYAEARGVGQQKYYVVGWDALTETPMVSLKGHLGRIEDDKFLELMTKTMYYNPSCMLWDMQKTLLSYAEAHDKLTGSSLLKEFMDGFDENNDGIIDYDENGRKGFWTPGFRILNHSYDIMLTEKYGQLRGVFYSIADFGLKPSRKGWNSQGHDFMQEYALVMIATQAFDMSRSEEGGEDPFIPGMKWGKGMWPSWQLATYIQLTNGIYGSQSPDSINFQSLYGTAFQYADKTRNGGAYTGSTDQLTSNPSSIKNYLQAVSDGADPLNFTLYVPAGYGKLKAHRIPNVEETDDPRKVFTAHFGSGVEVW